MKTKTKWLIATGSALLVTAALTIFLVVSTTKNPTKTTKPATPASSAPASSSQKSVSETDRLIEQFKNGDFSAIQGDWRIAKVDDQSKNPTAPGNFDTILSIGQSELSWSMPGYLDYATNMSPEYSSSLIADYKGKDPSNTNIYNGPVTMNNLSYVGLDHGMLVLQYSYLTIDSEPIQHRIYVIPQGMEIPNLKIKYITDSNGSSEKSAPFQDGIIPSDTSKMRLISFSGFLGGLGGVLAPTGTYNSLVGGLTAGYQRIFYRTSESNDYTNNPKEWIPEAQPHPMNISEIATGNFSSIEGTWSSKNHALTMYGPGNLLSGEAPTKVSVVAQGEGYVVLAITGSWSPDPIKRLFITAGTTIPAEFLSGVVDDSDTTKDRIIQFSGDSISLAPKDGAGYYMNSKTSFNY
ncbi:MAG: DUF6287 domain-containing protein [Streptococcaceae bacterium]|jgi:hypothetical protein|nr:DUF6287 domain-containing protein [Streptococcaceae bacterium]